MRFNLIDLLFEIACFTIGIVVATPLSAHLSGLSRLLAMAFGALCVYLALVYPFYRGLKLYPMILPKCPCCRKRQQGFHCFAGSWPRVRFRCPTCDGEFIVWHNGKTGAEETGETPVLALKWPYAFGIYTRARKPEAAAASE